MNYTAKRQAMTCGSAIAEEHVYRKIVDKNHNVWLVAVDVDNPAEFVYFHCLRDVNSDGFAGRVLTFKLEDGTEYKAKGPWHSNSDQLFRDTGVDVRDTYKTFGCIGLWRSMDDKCQTTIEDVLYIDDAPTLGLYSRIEKLAQSYADEQTIPVVYYSESSGGNLSAFVYPMETSYKDWIEWIKAEQQRRKKEKQNA